MNIPNRNNGNNLNQNRFRRVGFSMLEMLVVLAIMIATATIVIPLFTNIQIASPTGKLETSVEIVTHATLKTVRDALAGEDGVFESLSHKSNALPRRIDDLVHEQAPKHLEFVAPELREYDPVNKIGWRGPYLHATGRNKIGDPTLIDGWGNELELQIDFDENGEIDATESKFVRVVSSGPNGEIETPSDSKNMKPGKNQFSELTSLECGDDIVVFVHVPDTR